MSRDSMLFLAAMCILMSTNNVGPMPASAGPPPDTVAQAKA